MPDQCARKPKIALEPRVKFVSGGQKIIIFLNSRLFKGKGTEQDFRVADRYFDSLEGQ